MSAVKNYFDKIAEEGQLIVISGPSGVGKRTIINQYLKEHPNATRCTASNNKSSSRERSRW